MPFIVNCPNAKLSGKPKEVLVEEGGQVLPKPGLIQNAEFESRSQEAKSKASCIEAVLKASDGEMYEGSYSSESTSDDESRYVLAYQYLNPVLAWGYCQKVLVNFSGLLLLQV